MTRRRIRHIVTPQSLSQLLQNPALRMHVIGRALVVLFQRQTESEKRVNDTQVWNTVGFSGADGKSGCLSAKYYLKHKRLEDWQIDRWMRPARNGLPRICKYWRQLDEAAQARAAEQEKKDNPRMPFDPDRGW